MRRFLIKISYTVLPLWLVFFTAGLVYRYHISPNESGDLGRLGKLPFGHEYRQGLERNLLKENWVEDFNGKLTKGYRIITIGDSFSQQGKTGYQNYLGYLLENKVLNIRPAAGVTPVQLALSLLRTGWLRKMSPQVVLVETVERSMVEDLSQLDFRVQPSESAVRKQLYKRRSTPVRKSSNNLYETIYWLRLRLGIDDPVKKVDLKEDLFSVSEDELYFYYADLEHTSIKRNEREKIGIILDSLRQEFRQQGIQFVYLVAADKYHVYEPFIEDNVYPSTAQFDSLLAYVSPYIVNTVKTLRPLVRRGVKDVYMANDSHWSYIASEAVAWEIAVLLHKSGVAGNLFGASRREDRPENGKKE